MPTPDPSPALREAISLQQQEVSRLVTCVYCGQAYPAGTATHGAAVLTDHIKACPDHPLRIATERISFLEETIVGLQSQLAFWQRDRQELQQKDDAVIAEQAAELESLRKAAERANHTVEFYQKLSSPFYKIIPMQDQIKLRDLGYEIKYLPMYADQPDPTYIINWVWEIRDGNGTSVTQANKFLYEAIDAAIAAAPKQEK